MIKFLFRVLILCIFSINVSYSEIINDIKITGNKRITKETIVVIGQINFGDDYRDNELNDLTRRLYNSKFFKDISITFRHLTLTVHSALFI